MGLPSNAEQELLELINRFRADPAGEAARIIGGVGMTAAEAAAVNSALLYFTVDTALFAQQMAALASAPPLAWNNLLDDAAAAHSALMIAADTQSHQLPGEAGLGPRVAATGYKYESLGENIYAFASSAQFAHAGFVVDWGGGTGGMQTPAGHRLNLINAGLSEIGIDITPESNPATYVGPLVVTQELGRRQGYAPQIVGVVFDDGDGDTAYDAGEGRGGVSVAVVGAGGSFATTTWASGGYQIAVPAGNYTVTFSGGGIAGSYATTTSIAAANVAVDAMAAQFRPTSTVPVVRAADHAAAASGMTIPATALFTASDADGDTLYYNFWDGSTAATSGHWVINGVAQPTNTVIGVAAADLGGISFVTGTTDDMLYVRVSDGTTTTEWAMFQVTVPTLPVAAIGADVTVSEAAVRIALTVTLDAAPAATVTVPWSMADGTARIADGDMPYAQSGNAVFTPGGPLSTTVTVLVNDEAYKQENSETFSVRLGTPVGARLGRAEAVVTLTDDFVPPPAVALAMTDIATGTASTPAMSVYAGPLNHLDQAFIYLGADGIALSANAPNVFLRSGSGDDALAVTAGQNVLDGGTGSNFLTGGVGADTFFLDARGAAAATWSTVEALGAGDAVTLWGVTPADYALDWIEGAGAEGHTGLTMHATAAGKAAVSLTLAGMADADRTGGRLSVLFGTDPGSGSDYMYVFANG
ncbi:MAG: hypothetical protein IT555_13745 [Acetobacteraceae bacterium]|nr:hypothetical protein [Acetobacteraceae bacterium]